MAERVTAIAGIKHPEGFGPGAAGTPNSVSKERYPGYRPGHRIFRRTAEELTGAFSHIHITEGSIENLQEAVALKKAGKRASLLSDHKSDADGPVMGKSLRQAGAPEFADDIVIGMGDKVLRRRIRGFFARSYPYVPLPQIDSKVIQKGSKKYKQMLHDARVSIPNLMEDGKVFFTFPGGTRSLDGVLTEGRPQLPHYFPEDTFVLPMAMNGTREAWPVESFPRPFRHIYVCFGRPILIGEVIKQIDKYEKEKNRKIDKSTRNAIIVDTIMRQGIAPLVPPANRGIYSDMDVSPIEWVLTHSQQNDVKEEA